MTVAISGGSSSLAFLVSFVLTGGLLLATFRKRAGNADLAGSVIFTTLAIVSGYGTYAVEQDKYVTPVLVAQCVLVGLGLYVDRWLGHQDQ